MSLKVNMTVSEIVDYLKKDLKTSVINDIGACLNG
jgi:hypothetical protein